MTLKYLAILAMLPMLMIPAFAEEDESNYTQNVDADYGDLPAPVQAYIDSKLVREEDPVLHEPIELALFADVIIAMMGLIDIYNDVIESVNSNTVDIIELKQQIEELQTP